MGLEAQPLARKYATLQMLLRLEDMCIVPVQIG